MSSEKPAYKIRLHPEVISIDSKRFDESAKNKIKKKCKELLSQNPEQAGEPLRSPLHHYRKLRIFNNYRIVYRIQEQERKVRILAVGIRRDSEVYETAIKRLKKIETEEH